MDRDVKHEYRTTQGSWWHAHSKKETWEDDWKEVVAHYPHPVPPSGEGWELVCVSTTKATHFWHWKRKIEEAKKERKKKPLSVNDAVIAQQVANIGSL